MIRSNDEIEVLRKQQLDTVIYDFIHTKDLLNQVTDYGRFPAGRHKLNKSENIEVHKFWDIDFDLYKFVYEICDTVSTPFRVLMDCSLVLAHPTGILKSGAFECRLYK